MSAMLPNKHRAEICLGRVMHKRLRPITHQFSYGTFFLRVPLSKLASISNLFFSINKFNLLSLHVRDYGPRDGSDLATWARALLISEGIAEADGEIVLQTYPRILGYVFNPITIWYCFDQSGALRAAISEVSNTFGERHHYLISHNDNRAINANDWLITRKVFHVSPFCEVRGFYHFRFEQTFDSEAARAFAQIDFYDGSDDADKLIVTTLSGKPYPLTARRAINTLLTYPFMTVGVVARIHWQAFKLWQKNLPFYAKPAPPTVKTTRAISSSN
jgi:uncharacterized protein